DENVLEVVDRTKALKINRHGYKTPAYTINKGVTYVQFSDQQIPLQIIGKQNLSNIAGAYTVCEWLGVKQEEFYEAIKDFKSTIKDNNLQVEEIIDKITFAFKHPHLLVITSSEDLHQYLRDFDCSGTNMLFMSSDHYSGLNILTYAEEFYKQ